MYLRFKSSLIGFNPSLLFPGNLQNYYNPFNPETWIPYQLAVDTEVRSRNAAPKRVYRAIEARTDISPANNS